MFTCTFLHVWHIFSNYTELNINSVAFYTPSHYPDVRINKVSSKTSHEAIQHFIFKVYKIVQ